MKIKGSETKGAIYFFNLFDWSQDWSCYICQAILLLKEVGQGHGSLFLPTNDCNEEWSGQLLDLRQFKDYLSALEAAMPCNTNVRTPFLKCI
jgi:hypothetical protein